MQALHGGDIRAVMNWLDRPVFIQDALVARARAAAHCTEMTAGVCAVESAWSIPLSVRPFKLHPDLAGIAREAVAAVVGKLDQANHILDDRKTN